MDIPTPTLMKQPTLPVPKSFAIPSTPLRRSSRWGGGLTAAALLTAAAVAPAETLFRFEFNEGTGSTVTNTTSTFTGALGRIPNPDSNPQSNPSSPAGTASDRSVTIVSPTGFLLVDGTDAPALQAVDQPLTVEAWILIPEDAVPRPEGIAGFGSSWKFGLLPNGNVGFTLFGVVDGDSGILPSLGVWTHVAATWVPGESITFFVDGVAQTVLEETRPMRAPLNTWLGVGSGGLIEPVYASIDRLRIHRAVLAEGDLDSVAGSPKAALASTVVSYNFNEAAAPYASTGSLQRPALPAQATLIQAESPTWVTDAPSGQAGDTALSFDGNDVILVEDPSQLMTFESGDFTVQAWVKPGVLPTRRILFANNGPGGAFSFSITPDRLLFVTAYGILDISSVTARIPDDNNWHHVAVMHRNGQDMRFFVDGVLLSTVAYTQGIIYTRTDTFFRIGSEGGSPFVGSIDRIQVDNTAVDPSTLDFWRIPGVDPGIPELEVGTAVSIAWPSVATGFTLESTTDLTPPQTWTPINQAPTVVGDKYYILLPTPEAKTFYRLTRPE